MKLDKNALRIATISGLTAIASLVIWFAVSPSSTVDQGADTAGKTSAYLIPRVLRYSFTIQNKTNRFLEQTEVRILAPVKQTSFQESLSVTSSHAYQTRLDNLSNQELVFKLDMAPLATKIISITASLALAESSKSIGLDASESYLGIQKYVETDNHKIIALSDSLRRDDSSESLSAAFQWVADNITYAGYIEADRGALYALENRRGDCTEYMYLFAALARLSGIPTRGIGGFVVSEDAVLRARDFHNWAEVYVNGRWRVVDPQNKSFMQVENHYVALRILGNSRFSDNKTIENTHRVAYAHNDLEVRMN